MEEKKEEKINEEKDKVATPVESGEGDKTPLAIETDAANAAADRMVEEREKLEAATAQAKLAGTAEAGQQKEKPKEETPEEYANRVMSGEVVKK